MTTPAGYTSQICPTNPDHGKALAMQNGMWCPHHEHDTPKRNTRNYWTWDEWEAIDRSEPKSPTNQPHPSHARAIKVRKTIVRQANRRRTRKS